MKAINHLVLAAYDLVQIRDLYEQLGFTLTAPGQHPFGTGNTIIQMKGTYLELLAVTKPPDVVEHAPDEFSFSAFNRDYLARHEGFSMMVFDSKSAAADRESWKAKGIRVYAPFDFGRQAKLPNGEEITVGFSLALVSNPAAPWLGHFACQHFRPDYYEQPQFMTHRNGAKQVRDVWISGDGALNLASHFETLVSSAARKETEGRIVVPTRYGDIVLASASEFRAAFAEDPPHPEDGPHLAGLTIDCQSDGALTKRFLKPCGERQVVPSTKGFGTAIAFTRGR